METADATVSLLARPLHRISMNLIELVAGRLAIVPHKATMPSVVIEVFRRLKVSFKKRSPDVKADRIKETPSSPIPLPSRIKDDMFLLRLHSCSISLKEAKQMPQFSRLT